MQWITSCHKNRMTTCAITLWRVYVTSLTTSVPTMRFLFEITFILKAIKSHFIGSYMYDKQNLTLVVISYEIYENSQKACFINFTCNDHSCKILYIYDSGHCFSIQKTGFKHKIQSIDFKFIDRQHC